MYMITSGLHLFLGWGVLGGAPSLPAAVCAERAAETQLPPLLSGEEDGGSLDEGRCCRAGRAGDRIGPRPRGVVPEGTHLQRVGGRQVAQVGVDWRERQAAGSTTTTPPQSLQMTSVRFIPPVHVLILPRSAAG